MRIRTIPAFITGLIFLTGAGLRAEEAFFNSNGVKIHYTVEGKGEPVLLIHGFAANIELNWVLPGITKTLAKDYQVISMDNRGHGRSDKPHDPKKYGVEMVEDAVRLLDHLKIKKAHVVGYSMGSMITHKLIAMHPERLLSATLGGGAAVKLEGDDRFVEELAESLVNGKGMMVLMEALTPKGRPKPTEEELKTINQMIMSMNDPKALAAVVRGWKELGIADEKLKANQVPTLALIGGIDPLKTRVDYLKDRMANLKIVVIEGADHLDAVGKPAFINGLMKFLGEQSANGQRKSAPTPAKPGT
jgi:pimeloyl-ACP methyl ester carboxylesterase